MNSFLEKNEPPKPNTTSWRHSIYTYQLETQSPVSPPLPTTNNMMFPKIFETSVYTTQATICPMDIMVNHDLRHGDGQAGYQSPPAVECVYCVDNAFCDITI